MSDREMSGPGVAIALIGAIPAALLTLWWTVVAFTGGRMPIIGIETDGGLGFGLFWLFVVDPIVVGLVGFVTSLVLAPVLAPFMRRVDRSGD